MKRKNKLEHLILARLSQQITWQGQTLLKSITDKEKQVYNIDFCCQTYTTLFFVTDEKAK
jgi:hypothetical protein